MGSGKTSMTKIFNIKGNIVAASNDYWQKRIVDKLRQSFDYLKEARENMIHAKIHDKLYEQMFQSAGREIMDIAKAVNGVVDKEKETLKEILKDAKN